ncbi:MAG: Gfo/Idh/MocA family oxidoreductase [Planctomycetaceae bacterium]|nr:Gfo/Idh/MocA family oxidoreductase [Planctomycetaceae bacterium]
MTIDNSRSGSTNLGRRDFLKKSVLATAGMTLAGGLGVARSAHAAGSDTIKIALVGCGGRGTGAAINALQTRANVKLVAMADAFKDSLDQSLATIRKQCKDRVEVPADRQFTGLDAYQRAIDSDVGMVLLCTPPGFRPRHFEAAVKAGKHVFMEKPLATDTPGLRRIQAANAEAKRKNLAVAVGHHLRHEVKHREIVRRIHDGQLGDLTFLRVYFNSGGLWIRPRQPGQTEMQYQVRNWYYFTWLCGDHILEQHVHDLDVGNWIAQTHPIEAQGMGGRQVRVGREVGEIFDHHTVEFTYANGLKMFSYCRHIPGCWEAFSEHAHGTKGVADIQGYGPAVMKIAGQRPIRLRQGPDGHQVEMDDLMAAIVAGQPYNEADWAAESTMTGIMGRIATYSGKIVTWDDAMASEVDLTPKNLAWNSPTLVNPGPDGCYPCAIPGVTKAL